MQLTKSFMLLAAIATGALARPEGHERRQWSATTTASTAASSSSSGASSDWTSVPSNGVFSSSGFGGVTASSGSGDTYKGNQGSPYGSNIIEVSASDASQYKYVVQMQGSASEDLAVVFWNKFNGDHSGFFSSVSAAKSVTIAAGATKYFAFDTDSQGGWAAASGSVPTTNYGEYGATWGEFDFGSNINNGYSGFDVSAIVPQSANMTVQGMQMCSKYPEEICSTITPNAATVDNAYTTAQTAVGGIGGKVNPGAVRLAVKLGYTG